MIKNLVQVRGWIGFICGPYILWDYVESNKKNLEWAPFNSYTDSSENEVIVNLI